MTANFYGMWNKLFHIFTFLFLTGTVCYLFFDRIWLVVFISPISVFYLKLIEKERLRRKNQLHLQQLKEMLNSIIPSMSSGNSLENSMQTALNDMRFLYGNLENEFILGIEKINMQLANGVVIEKALQQFSNELKLKEMDRFTDLIVHVKRKSGGMLDVIRKFSLMIFEQYQVEQEMTVIIAKKKFEMKLLFIIPLLFLSLLKYTSSDYIQPLYEMKQGVMIMFISLVMFLFSYWISEKIMDIK